MFSFSGECHLIILFIETCTKNVKGEMTENNTRLLPVVRYKKDRKKKISLRYDKQSSLLKKTSYYLFFTSLLWSNLIFWISRFYRLLLLWLLFNNNYFISFLFQHNQTVALVSAATEPLWLLSNVFMKDTQPAITFKSSTWNISDTNQENVSLIKKKLPSQQGSWGLTMLKD